ncbi:MAG: proton-conducting transporter membrane subunit [Desulfurococcaceae archaeon]
MIDIIIGVIPFLPAFAGFTIPIVYLVSRKRLVVMGYATIILAITTVLSAIVAYEAFRVEHPIVFRAGGWPAPIGITYIVDRFCALIGLLTSFIILSILLYSISYITDEAYPWYVILVLGNSAGILGVAYTGDLFNLFVMLEVTGVSAYALVMYYRNRPVAIVSGLKYAFIGSLGTSLYLLAMGLTYSFYGTLNLVDFSYKVTNYIDTLHLFAYGLIMILALWTFSIKSGVFPNHFWLPDAHPAAPTPISALLSGLVVNTGIIGLYKFLYIASWNSYRTPLNSIMELASLAVILMGSLSGVFGALLMNIQRDVKRLIAYSTVMNLGFLFMGIGCLTFKGLQATLYYVITHSLAKATLFLSTGVFIKASGSRLLDNLSGSGMKYKAAGVAFAVSTLTLAGIPPLPGFLAKLLLYEALFEYNIALAILMVVTSAIGLLAYMKLLYIVLFGAPISLFRKVDMKLAQATLLILTVTIIIVGTVFLFIPEVTQSIIGSAALQSTINIENYVEYVENTFIKP